jgi:metal-responsive CopG/Arc/MetJ family transcriptional regulator
MEEQEKLDREIVSIYIRKDMLEAIDDAIKDAVFAGVRNRSGIIELALTKILPVKEVSA